MGVVLNPSNGIWEEWIWVVSEVIHNLLPSQNNYPARISVES